ncbi:HGGxSTG domain-containing protein [uncultured Bradyrhizobium sp.]|jgi:glucans biosynthesis protein|uniref:HGGxSTG domain-containing protein n=1 Tax=uncultured Bradyrhizobium sp. TaxID=199684 RepID=UPI0026392062|nr:HGGxSTG domain-containing protein [uncultured Bradyrhizobium sp.]
MSHARNTASMRASIRCGARTRSGETCRAPALRGKMRCRMHGGAWGSGAPDGNSNAVKHGFFTSEAIEERKFVRTILAEAESLLCQLPAQPQKNATPRENGTQPTPGTESPVRNSHMLESEVRHGPIKADEADRDRRRG